jgi:hypothetical protein
LILIIWLREKKTFFPFVFLVSESNSDSRKILTLYCLTFFHATEVFYAQYFGKISIGQRDRGGDTPPPNYRTCLMPEYYFHIFIASEVRRFCRLLFASLISKVILYVLTVLYYCILDPVSRYRIPWVLYPVLGTVFLLRYYFLQNNSSAQIGIRTTNAMIHQGSYNGRFVPFGRCVT